MTTSLRLCSVLVVLTVAVACSGADSASNGDKSGSPSGGSGTTTPSSFPDAQVYVDAHNAVRAAVTEPAGYVGNWQPLPPVTWSNEVATTAQAWADNLKSTMSCGLQHASNTGYGENLAEAGTRLGPQKAPLICGRARTEELHTYATKYAFSADTGHYTQLVWRKSTQIGCGSAACANGTVIVCRYSPPGNYIGEQIF